MKRMMFLFLIGCGATVSTEPVQSKDAANEQIPDAGSDVIPYQKPEPKHIPDAMPSICGVATCYAFSDNRDMGFCDPCQDAGTLCWMHGENGVCEFR